MNRTSNIERPTPNIERFPLSIRRRERRAGRSGFTLVELAVVLLVIGILATLLFGVLRGVQSRTRRVAAAREVNAIEQAWRAYHTHYNRWPAFATEHEDGIAVTGAVALVLQGDSVGADNRDRIAFIEFSRFDANGDPVNPWGYADRVSNDAFYRVRFDADYDNRIEDVFGEASVRRPVVVWTVNGDDDSRIIGSWQ